jgi:hypothetical protein
LKYQYRRFGGPCCFIVRAKEWAEREIKVHDKIWEIEARALIVRMKIVDP